MRFPGDRNRIWSYFSASCWPFARQADQQAAASSGIGAGLSQAAGGEPVDHALDGGDIHRVSRQDGSCEHGPVSVSFASAAHCVGVR